MKSSWLSTIKFLPALPPLLEDIAADIVIIGGGLAGTLTSYLLAKEGKKVVVLEKKDITHSMTAYTTAWLSAAIDTDWWDLSEMYGNNGAKSIWKSHKEAIDIIEKIVEEENIDCEFMRVSQFRYATNEDQMENLKEEYEIAKLLDIAATLHEPSFLDFANHGSLEIKNQAKFHPLKFLIALRESATKLGVVFYENTEVEKLEDLEEGKKVLATSRHGSAEAEYSITTTYEPFDKPQELFAHKGSYKTYVLEATTSEETIAEGLYEDEQNPYHYLRVDKLEKENRIIFGGEDHRKEIPVPEEKNFESLILNLNKIIPSDKYTITKKWMGVIIETIDGLPYIGSYSKDHPRRLVATGFSGNGMTYSAISAQILRDIILGKENPYHDLYHAGRRTKIISLWKKFIDFSGEFFGYARNLYEARKTSHNKS